MIFDNGKLNQAELMSYIQKGLSELKTQKAILHEPEVRVLADSISPAGIRLISLECKFWRPILPELSRHRTFSLSVRSSRAVSTETYISELKENLWGPQEWGSNQKGMQAGPQLSEHLQTIASYVWNICGKNSVQMAEQLNKLGVHKQIVNRLLEPYSCTHAVVSATEWDNFFKLRISEQAQPEMKTLAVKMKEAIDSSKPVELKKGEWHLPYVTEDEKKDYKQDILCALSAARCARVSYKLPDANGNMDLDKDLALAKKLVDNGHWSPWESIATPAGKTNYRLSNFKGWNQKRKYLEEPRFEID